MREELRKLGRLNNVPLNISKHIISQRLHNLVDIEEHHVHRMALERSHRVLDDEWMVAISRHEVRHRRDWVDRLPVKQVLLFLVERHGTLGYTYLELERHITR